MKRFCTIEEQLVTLLSFADTYKLNAVKEEIFLSEIRG